MSVHHLTLSRAGYSVQVYSVSTHGTYAELVERLVPLMRDAGVALYMSGHDHQLQHLRIDAAPGQPVDPGSRPNSLEPPPPPPLVRV